MNVNMNRDCLERQLDFHAPLLSTRRPGRIIVPREKWDMDSSSGFNDRVPFSWEQSPGKPKEILIRARRKEENKSNTNSLSFLMPLKPPPIPRLSKREEAYNDDDDDDHDEDDDGCDGDVDDNDEDRDPFSGGLDLFSLAESSENGMPAKSKKSRRVGGKAGGGGRRRAPPTPSYIMERFLPDAVALAAASSSYFAMEAQGMAANRLGFRGCESDAPAAEGCTPRSSRMMVGGRRVLASVTSSPLAFKSCGLHNLLPWRANRPKPKKSPIRGLFQFGCSDDRPQLRPGPKYRS